MDRATEHERDGKLYVPVARSIDREPVRKGWEAFWVNINLSDPVQKVVVYKRPKGKVV